MKIRRGARSLLLATTLLAGVALVCAEAGLRVARFGASAAALGRWRGHSPPWSLIRTVDLDGRPRPIPNGRARWPMSLGDPPGPPIEYRLDENGFRIAGPKGTTGSPGTCRVLALGDADTFGLGVEAEDAFPAQLETLLRAQGADIRVHNAGLNGSNMLNQRAWLEEILPRAAPDLVLIAGTPWSLRIDQNLVLGGPGGATLSEKLWNVGFTWLRRVSAYSALIDRTTLRALHLLHDAVGWPPSQGIANEMLPLVEPSAEFARRWTGVAGTLEDMVRLAQARGADAVLVFIPLDVQVSYERNRLYREERISPAFGFVDRDYSRDDRHTRAMHALAARLKIAAIDVTPALRMDGAGAFLAEDYHPSAAGYRRMAAALAPVVATACRARR